MINATTDTTKDSSKEAAFPVSENIKSDSTPTTPKTSLPEQKKDMEMEKAPKPKDNSSGGSDTTAPKKKSNIKMILGVVVLLFIILGAGSAMFLSQQTQDIRQQASTDGIYQCGAFTCGDIAYYGQDCEYDDNGTGVGCPQRWEICPPEHPATNKENPSCGGGDPDPDDGNYCSTCVGSCGTTGCTTSCTGGNPHECYGDGTGGIFTASFVCEGEHLSCNDANGSTNLPSPLDYTNNSDTWCKTYQFDSNAPNGAFSVVFVGNNGVVCTDQGCINSNPGFWNCSVQLSCDSVCTSDAECQAVNPDWFCKDDLFEDSKCRLRDHPSSSSCEVPTYSCGIECVAQTDGSDPCTAQDATLFCHNPSSGGADAPFNVCRKIENPDSISCEVVVEVLECNDACTTTAECQADLGSLYSCENNLCRLTSNPTSEICEDVIEDPVCNDLCRTDSECPADLICYFDAARTGNCRNPDNLPSEICEDIIEPLECNDACTLDSDCGDELICYYNDKGVSNCRNPKFPTEINCQPPLTCRSKCNPSDFIDQCTRTDKTLSCDFTTKECRLTANPESLVCEDAEVPICNDRCTSDRDCSEIGLICYANDIGIKNCRNPENPTSESCEDALVPMCVDVAILNTNNEELDPDVTPLVIDQTIRLRCSGDNTDSVLFDHYEFRVIEPGQIITELTSLSFNPMISEDYTIPDGGNFTAQCRLCLTTGCQEYQTISRGGGVDLGN